LPSFAETAPPAAQSPRELADQYGLTRIDARPSLLDYSRQLWSRRHFIIALASAKNSSVYADTRLGQMWQLLTPLLNTGIYYVVFGVFLHTSHGIHNFIAYLVVGIFVFDFTQGSVLGGTHAISRNLHIIRTLRFPRACLPIAFTALRAQQMLVFLVALFAVVLGTGEPVTWRWLLLGPILILQLIFNVGISLAVARISATIIDIKQLVPFMLRSWMYLSGVFWSIGTVSRHLGPRVAWIRNVNPAATFINLMRNALITVPDTANDETRTAMHIATHSWLIAVGWAALVGAGGFVYFWKAESSYGRG